MPSGTLEKTSPEPACLHCGKKVPAGTPFCCDGCSAVHALLLKRGLGHFYELRDRQPLSAPRPVSAGSEALPALPGEQLTARLYIEGIHCLGCLWLLEKLPALDERIAGASLDFTHAILEVTRTPAIGWGEVASLIRELGYQPRVLADDEGARERKAELTRQAVRLGVAGFCAGNIMLLAISLYAGAEGSLAQSFRLLSFALSLPALTYSAWPLYRSAWIPLRNGRASVDLAISLAILAGAGLSALNLARGGGETYFDSLTMLVFLLLASRFLLNRFRESLARETPCLSFLSREEYTRTSPGPGAVAADALLPGDRISLRPGQTLPTDARLEGSAAYFDFSLLNGESAPVKLLRGDSVEAGARCLTPNTDVSVVRPAAESRLARILDQIRSFRLTRSPSLDFADRVGRRFVLVVLALAAAVSLLLPFPDGVHRALVLVIVTCPCVLAFAVPLAFTRALQQAARAGILFRAADKVEELAAARTVFLDKTGTLTNGDFEVFRWEQLEGEDQATRAAVLALELASPHPVAKALVRYLNGHPLPVIPADKITELPGRGMRGNVGPELWELRGIARDGDVENLVGVYRDGSLLARVALGDQLRPDASAFVASLRREGLEPVILSGDTPARVASVARAVGVSGYRSRLSPEDKAAIVRDTPHSVMIGDGANDAVAFQAARVSIAVRGAVELSLRNADVTLATPGLDGALRALSTARRALCVVRANFAISLAYNVLAGLFAVSGAMSPLLAATLMPLSALSVFAFTQIATAKPRAPGEPFPGCVPLAGVKA